MKFNVIEFPSSFFTWSQGVAHAEASDMENRHLQPLYDDACDVGFAIKSDKTGEVVTYVMETPVYDIGEEERELLGWRYVPTAESIRKVPACANTKAVIYND